MILVAPGIGDALKRLIEVPCTVLHAVSHFTETETFIPRDDMISNDKSETEGAPEETNNFLGCRLDIRELLVTLP